MSIKESHKLALSRLESKEEFWFLKSQPLVLHAILGFKPECLMSWNLELQLTWLMDNASSNFTPSAQPAPKVQLSRLSYRLQVFSISSNGLNAYKFKSLTSVNQWLLDFDQKNQQILWRFSESYWWSPQLAMSPWNPWDLKSWLSNPKLLDSMLVPSQSLHAITYQWPHALPKMNSLGSSATPVHILLYSTAMIDGSMNQTTFSRRGINKSCFSSQSLLHRIARVFLSSTCALSSQISLKYFKTYFCFLSSFQKFALEEVHLCPKECFQTLLLLVFDLLQKTAEIVRVPVASHRWFRLWRSSKTWSNYARNSSKSFQIKSCCPCPGSKQLPVFVYFGKFRFPFCDSWHA